MVRAAVSMEGRAGLETLNIGRDGLGPEDSCCLEITGRHLFYSLLLDGGLVFVSVQPMDSVESLEKLVILPDGADGWRTVCRFVLALERSGRQSLTPRPIELGTPGSPDSWVIA
jgi:hypothetical protein